MPPKKAGPYANMSVNDAIKRFHKDRMSSLIKEAKCDGCENCMKFKASEHSLVLSCGSERGKCGDQVEITLPIYKKYEDERLDLANMLTYNDDIYDFSRYNLEKVVKAHDFSDNFRERALEGERFRSTIKEERDDLERSFSKENNMRDKEEIIREVANQRHKISDERLKLEQSINVSEDPMKRHQYRRDLAKLALRERDQIITRLQSLKEPLIRMWPEEDDGAGVFSRDESSVVEKQQTYHTQEKKKRKKKKAKA